MCFLKNIQPLRHGKIDGHIRIQMQKRRILLFLRHAALANTVASKNTNRMLTNGAFIGLFLHFSVYEARKEPKSDHIKPKNQKTTKITSIP